PGSGRQSWILVRATSSFPGALRLPGLRRYTATGGACRTRTPRSSIPQRERGIEGRSPDKAEGRIRGMGANHGYSCTRHPRSRVRFAYPGYAATPRPVAPAEPEPLTPRSPQRERGIEGVARIRPKAASGEMGEDGKSVE